MSSTNHIIRSRLGILYNQLANIEKAPVADDGHHINNPSALKILHITQFCFEHLDVETNPQILFKPMPLSELQKDPVDPDGMDEGRSFMNYQDRPDNLHWNAKACAMRVCDCVEDRATGSARGISDLLEIRGLQEVRMPNLFLLNHILYGCYLDTSLRYLHCTILETERDNSQNAHPLVVISGYQPCNGKENHILYGELALLVITMQNRTKQPTAKDKEEAEELFNIIQRLRLRYHDKRRLPIEKHFPILLLPLVGLQHGRMFYTCMD